jgi:triacylglycerol lipase
MPEFELSPVSWVLLLVAGVVAVLAATAAFRRRARRGPAVPTPERPPLLLPQASLPPASPPPSEPSEEAPPRTTRFPLVLVHGYFGFDAIGVRRLRSEYFRGVRRRLESAGHEVHVVRINPVAGVDVRARQLARQIEAIEAPRVNIVAHSMGGLDARFAISRLGLAARVASLTTVGTPHRGTPLADGAFSLGKWSTARRLLSSLGANVDGLHDLTTARMEEFNREVADSADVRYCSVVATVNPEAPRVNALLSAGHGYLARRAGPNDGIVPAASQRWGDVLHEVEADHWAQVGWSSAFDAGTFYVSIAERLAERGF